MADQNRKIELDEIPAETDFEIDDRYIILGVLSSSTPKKKYKETKSSVIEERYTEFKVLDKPRALFRIPGSYRSIKCQPTPEIDRYPNKKK